MSKAADKPLTKTQIIANLAEKTGLSKKDITAVMEALTDEIRKSMSAKGPGVFSIPGLVKINKKKVPPRPARKGVMSFGKLIDVPAKKGYTKIKVTAFKALKEMA